MDLVKLDAPAGSTYIPQSIVTGYNSLIWTERFQAHGEFVLKSYDPSMQGKLPIGTFVSHLETTEVMIVETHEINMVGEGVDAVPEITIKGRSASLILEHRWVEADYQKKRRMRRTYTATGAAGVLLYNAVANTSGADVTRGDDDPDTENVKNHYPWNTKDALPNVVVSEVVGTEGPLRRFYLEQGILYPQLMRILIGADLGLRVVRPVLPNNLSVLTVQTALEGRGTVMRTPTTNVSQMRFEIYSGTDRSSGSGAVQFSEIQGHLDKVQSLISEQPHKTAVEMQSGAISVADVYLPGDYGLTGWNRRVMGFDAGTPEIPDPPEKPDEPGDDATAAQRKKYRQDITKWKTRRAKWKNKRDLIVDEFRTEQTERAKTELKRQRRLDMFSADISPNAPYRYKGHYNLGDLVMLHTKRGTSTVMMVSEHVRTEDTNGDRGIPGLVAP